jgi:hypothetical protein
MTANIAPVTAAATTYGDERAADQLAVDKVAYDALAAEYAAYRAAHPDTPAPAGTLLGSSLNGPAFKSAAAGGLGYTKTTIARVYLRALPKGSTWTNIIGDAGATSDLKDACAKATKVIWLSWKEPDPVLVDAFLATMPGLDQAVWGTMHHEPENDLPGYTAAQYVADQKRHSPVARKHGLTFATILMRYTFSAGSGRNWRDWWPDSLVPFVDIFGCDSYNLGNKKGTYSDVASQLTPIHAAADTVGKPWAIGETGASIFNNQPAPRAKWAQDLAGEAGRQQALAIAWWDQDSYVLDAPTATVWLGKL